MSLKYLEQKATNIQNKSSITLFTIIFILIYLTAWFLNGYGITKFSLNELMNIYQLLIPKIAEYTIQSIYNSPRGEKPKE